MITLTIDQPTNAAISAIYALGGKVIGFHLFAPGLYNGTDLGARWFNENEGKNPELKVIETRFVHGNGGCLTQWAVDQFDRDLLESLSKIQFKDGVPLITSIHSDALIRWIEKQQA